MEIQTLDKANELRQTINKLLKELNALGRSGNTLRVYYMSGQGDTLFSTIGTGENCEHPDADLADSFFKQLILRRQDALHEAERQFRAL